MARPMNRSKTMVKQLTVLLLCAMVLFPAVLFGWGREGHRIVAKIAAKNLSSDARKKVAAILKTTEADVEAAMADASTWPDEISKPKTKTANWHFVDVPVTAPFSIGTLCDA